MADSQFYLHTSNRAENLAARLVQVSREMPLARTLSQETVMTLNPGIARWLQFEISTLAGVSFGWEFPLPGKLFARMLRGFEPSYEYEGLFDEDRARWILLDLLEKLEDQPRFAQVRAYCDAAGGSRRLPFAQRLVTLFDEYLVYRPETLVSWEEDPESSKFDWQAELWRRLVSRLYSNSGVPRHIARVWKRLRSGELLELSFQPQHWPERLFVFGVSSLAPLYIDILEAFSKYRPVHIFLLQPSDLYWADFRTNKQIQKIIRKQRAKAKQSGQSIPQLNKPEDWLFDTGNPLLPAFGKQGQMFLDLLIDKNPIQDDIAFEEPSDGETLLKSLQSDLFKTERRDVGSGSDPFPEYDGTIQVHSCSNPRREVETLWDYLVQRFDDEPGLQPNEILVMAPEIQKYRPHIEAVFQAKTGTNLEIPYSIADSNSGNKPGVLSGFAAILKAAPQRMSAAETVALLETPLVREVFSFSDQDLEHIVFWIRELGITWGWNGQHRASHNSFRTERNTWRELRQRLMSGVMLSESITLPTGYSAYCEVESNLADTAGRLVAALHFIERLHEFGDKQYSLTQWQSLYLELLDELSTTRDDWETQQRQARQLIQECFPEDHDLVITGHEANRALCEKLNSLPSGSGYLSGGITFCSLKPMRAIPANTVCLLGMNRLDFPRSNRRMRFDLLAKENRTGDRNTRDEDRQFFLETLLSARSHLMISYQGISATSDTLVEPSSVVEELRQYLSRSCTETSFQKIFHKQKRLSFDSIYFEDETCKTYDPDRVQRFNRFYRLSPKISPELTEVEAIPEPDELSLEELIRFYNDPAKYYVEQVASAKIARSQDALPDTDLLDYDPLNRYQLRKLLEEVVWNNSKLEDLSTNPYVLGKLLPPGKVQEIMLNEELESAQQLAIAIEAPVERLQRHVSIGIADLNVAGDIVLRADNNSQLLIFAGAINAKREVETWIRHLYALIAYPDFSGQTIAYSLQSIEKPLSFANVEGAKEQFQVLVHFFLNGLRQPLGWFPEAAKTASTALRNSKVDSEEVRHQQAIANSNARIARTDPAESFSTSEWNQNCELCFGSDFRLGEPFLELVEAIRLPLDHAVQGGRRK